MTSDKKRAFRLSPEARDFVGGAKVQTEPQQVRHAGRRDVDPVPLTDNMPHPAGRRSADGKVGHAPGASLHDMLYGAEQHGTQQHKAAQHSTEWRGEEPNRLHPWEDLSAGSKTINFKFTPELYAMATWCKANVPGGVSYLELLRRGCELACRELIEKHYKPEEE